MTETIGREWGMLGDVEKSEGVAVVDEVDGSYEPGTVGLTARQLDNMGADYGRLLMDVGDETVETDYINAYGENSPNTEDGIIVSSDVAEEYDITPGDKVKLVRESTETGELLYEVRNHDGEFGQNWDYQGTPQSVVPVFLDGDEEDARVGLSAMQMRNIDASDGSVVQFSYDGKKGEAEVYNAAGIRAVGGKGVRVSEPLAEETGVEQGEEFSIDQVLDEGKGNQLRNTEDVAEMLDENNRRGQS